MLMGCVLVWRSGLTQMYPSGQVLSQQDSSLTVEERVTALEKRVTALEKKGATTVSKTSAKKESYLTLVSGTATGGNWVTVTGSEFWLDQSLYGNVVQVTWEGWLKVQDGNGVGMARLYDVTNNRAVDFSEVSVSGRERASFYSKALAIWRGQNQYRVELKSSTAYPVTISDARLRITTQ